MARLADVVSGTRGSELPGLTAMAERPTAVVRSAPGAWAPPPASWRCGTPLDLDLPPSRGPFDAWASEFPPTRPVPPPRSAVPEGTAEAPHPVACPSGPQRGGSRLFFVPVGLTAAARGTLRCACRARRPGRRLRGPAWPRGRLAGALVRAGPGPSLRGSFLGPERPGVHASGRSLLRGLAGAHSHVRHPCRLGSLSPESVEADGR